MVTHLWAVKLLGAGSGRLGSVRIDFPLGLESRFCLRADPPFFPSFPPLQSVDTSYLKWTVRLN